MMPVILTALVAIGVHAVNLLGRRMRRRAGAGQKLPTGADPPAVGARRPRLASRRQAA